VLERGRQTEVRAKRWALEDAWRDPLALRCWSRFAQRLTAAQAEQIVLRVSHPELDGFWTQAFAPDAATEGWALEKGGYGGEALDQLAPPTRACGRSSVSRFAARRFRSGQAVALITDSAGGRNVARELPGG
jgi:hypothetical protein